MGKRRTALMLAGALLTGMIVGAGSSMAMAGTASSANGYFSVNGINYSDYAYVSTSPGSVGAGTLIKGTNTSVPSGWAGANARLFTSSGSLYYETGFIYNGGSMYAGGYLSQATGDFGVSRGSNWYSYGVVRGWNGGGYNSYYTFQSPNQTS